MIYNSCLLLFYNTCNNSLDTQCIVIFMCVYSYLKIAKEQKKNIKGYNGTKWEKEAGIFVDFTLIFAY